jgi:hypothetical protein
MHVKDETNHNNSMPLYHDRSRVGTDKKATPPDIYKREPS